VYIYIYICWACPIEGFDIFISQIFKVLYFRYYCMSVLRYKYLYMYMLTFYETKIKWKMEVQEIFLNPFTICSLSKWKFIVCSIVDKETNRCYPFANGLNRLSHLLWPPMLNSMKCHSNHIQLGRGGGGDVVTFHSTQHFDLVTKRGIVNNFKRK
jgi:hypothetical protein